MGQWSRTCRSSKHLVQLYQASLKRGDDNREANFIFEDNVELMHKIDNNAKANVKPMHLDVADFFIFPKGKIISDDPR